MWSNKANPTPRHSAHGGPGPSGSRFSSSSSSSSSAAYVQPANGGLSKKDDKGAKSSTASSSSSSSSAASVQSAKSAPSKKDGIQRTSVVPKQQFAPGGLDPFELTFSLSSFLSAASPSPTQMVPEEVLPDTLSLNSIPEIAQITVDYFDGDMDTKTCNQQQRDQFRMFRRSIHEVLRPVALRIFPHVLAGDEKAFELIAERPAVVHCRFDAKDQFGRVMRNKTLIDWYGALGDVNLRTLDLGEKDHGGVERVAHIVGWDIVAEQLRKHFPAGWEARDTRMPRIFAAFEIFAEKRMSIPLDLLLVEPIRQEFISALNKICQEEITEGFIYSLSIFSMVTKYIGKNLERFGGLAAPETRWLGRGCELLQYYVSPRDARVFQFGICHVIPPWSRLPRRPLDISVLATERDVAWAEVDGNGDRIGLEGGAWTAWGRWGTFVKAAARLSQARTSALQSYVMPGKEVFPESLFSPIPGIAQLVVDYFDGDVDTKTCNQQQHDQFRMFRRNIHEVLRPVALRIFPHVLAGDEKAFELIAERPAVVHCRFDAKDQFGRVMRNKTLIDWYGALGDVNLRILKQGEKDHGGVERVAHIVGQDIVAEQLRRHFSAGWEARDTRTPRIFAAFKVFAEKLMKMDIPRDLSFEDQEKFIGPIKQEFIGALNKIFQEEITEGFVYNLNLFPMVLKYIEENLERFGGFCATKIDLLSVAGYGLLQWYVSPRSAQALRYGIVNVIFGQLPMRPLDISMHTADCKQDVFSLLGVGHFVDAHGDEHRYLSCASARDPFGDVQAYGTFISRQNISVASLCNAQTVNPKPTVEIHRRIPKKRGREGTF